MQAIATHYENIQINCDSLFCLLFLFCVYLILKMTFPEIFIKDKCKWILGFSYFVLPLLSTAMNPVILFFSSNFRHALQTLLPFRRTNFCCSCFKGRKAEDPISQSERGTTALQWYCSNTLSGMWDEVVCRRKQRFDRGSDFPKFMDPRRISSLHI